MRRFVSLAVVSALVGIGACGKSAEQKRQEEASKQVAQAAKTTEQAAKQAASGLEQMANGLAKMAAGAAAGAGDLKPVDPVSFRDLETLFPELDGWKKEKPTGERMTSPFAYSQAQVRYTNEPASLELKIVDSGFNQLLLTPYAIFLQAGYEKETSEGYEKSTKVNDQPGWEKWNDDSKSGELNALVAKRFLISIEGRHIDGNKVLRDVAARLDMNKLAAMK
jgi:X-X-X-Leu-X-X-Gly heptad repeat protein